MKYLGRIWILFMCFSLVVSMSLINNDGNIVLAVESEEGYGFEATTAGDQVTVVKSEFFTSWNKTEGSFVDTTVAESGTKSYRVDDAVSGSGEAYFNSSLGEDVYLVNMSFWVYFPDVGANTEWASYHRLFDYNGNRLLEYGFITSAGNLAFGYTDHNDIWQTIKLQVAQDQWQKIYFNYVSNDSVTIGIFDNNNATTEDTDIQPYNVVDIPKWNYIRMVASSHLFGDDLIYIDNFNVTFEDRAWWGGVLGDITLNVFNESNIDQAVTNWDVFVKTTGGAMLYSLTSQSNPVVIDLYHIGFGDRVFEFYADGYFERYYALVGDKQLVRGANHTLTAYLPPVSEAYLYYIKVQNEIEQPVYNAFLEISRNFNGTIDNVAGGYTDIFGMYPIYLVGSQQYAINITHSNYDTFRGTFITDPNSYGYDNPIIFQLGTATTQRDWDSFWQTITFKGVMTSPGYPQLGNITITYLDTNESTTDTQIRLYESYNGTITFKNTNSKTGNNNYNYKVGSINTSRLHYAMLWFNNSAVLDVVSPVTIVIYPISFHSDRTPFDLDDRISDIVGDFKIQDQIVLWTNILAIVLPTIILCSLGVYDTGAGLLGCGLSIGLMQGLYATMLTNSFNIVLAALCPLILVVAIVYIWTKGQGAENL